MDFRIHFSVQSNRSLLENAVAYIFVSVALALLGWSFAISAGIFRATNQEAELALSMIVSLALIVFSLILIRD
jgi:hypothetical protein